MIDRLLRKVDCFIYSWLGRSILKSNVDRTQKIFVLSFQRNATTSTGRFLRKLGYDVASQPVANSKNWSDLALSNNFDQIFDSPQFRYYQAFEDHPWWFPDMHIQLYKRFPNAKYILITRDAEEWFDSVLRMNKDAQTDGLSEGKVHNHVRIYRREEEYESNKIMYANGVPLNKTHQDRYVKIYQDANQSVLKFFEGKKNFIHLAISDNDKWKKIALFLGHDQMKKEDLEVHANKSK